MGTQGLVSGDTNPVFATDNKRTTPNHYGYATWTSGHHSNSTCFIGRQSLPKPDAEPSVQSEQHLAVHDVQCCACARAMFKGEFKLGL